MAPGFVHLHVHSACSLLEGALPVACIAALAKADRLTVIAGNASASMRLAFVLACGLVAASPAAAATGNAGGPSALALAAVVASHSSVLGSYDRRAMARLFSGHSTISFPPNRKISVTADAVMCRVSNVAITARSCELTFKVGSKRQLTGRDANELYATLAVAGVMAEGAAGSLIEDVTKLSCTIDPNTIKQKAGGGADCTFNTQE